MRYFETECIMTC